MKLNGQFAGLKNLERKKKELAKIQIETEVKKKVNELNFLQAMIKEMEEKYRIELRKKAILKTQCDQAFLKGVNAISMEALKMSHSTLTDYYRGMKMPSYNGNQAQIYNQIRSMNGASTGF